MKLRRIGQLVTTSGGGSVDQLVGGLSDPYIFTGFLYGISYVKDLVNPYTDGVDFNINVTDNTFRVWVETNVNASKVVYPRGDAHDQAGDPVYVNSSAEAEQRLHPLINDTITITITSGGASKVGSFYIFVLDHFDFAGGTLT